ncbi:MAG: hypothetical protein NWE93_11680 [Candidatus Bathyarchaeota archaeon]|nr:hypothetical protein [Candidatus Bathyarchaeota archaeon]
MELVFYGHLPLLCIGKGRTDADEDAPKGAGSPISRMPQTTKGGLQPTHQPIYCRNEQKGNWLEECPKKKSAVTGQSPMNKSIYFFIGQN